MRKKCLCAAVFAFAVAVHIPADDQIFFELNSGVYFYSALGAKIGWMHYWENEKVGFICDINYFNNGFVDEFEGDWQEAVQIAHNIGLAAGVVFNNMGMSGVIRTSEHIKLKGVYSIWERPTFYPFLDLGFNLGLFFSDNAGITAGVGIEPLIIPYLVYFHFSVGMVFTVL
jgi:hypothetical protein